MVEASASQRKSSPAEKGRRKGRELTEDDEVLLRDRRGSPARDAVEDLVPDVGSSRGHPEEQVERGGRD